MKIKTVCDFTGLTDRTIRYYIEEGLISPSYTENYLGRKSFEFSDEVIKMLKSIAVLRTFGFSIAHIKSIIETPDVINSIVEEIHDRKSKIINEEQEQLNALEGLDKTKSYTLWDLADALSAPVNEISIPAEDMKINVKALVLSVLKTASVWILCFLPVVFLLYSIFSTLQVYSYPTLSFRSFVAVYLTLIPTIAFFLCQRSIRRDRL